MQAKIKDLFASTAEIVASKLTSLFSSISLERFSPNNALGALSKAWPGSMPGSLSEAFERGMAPCMRLMGKLDLNTKLLSLFAGFFIVMVVLTAHTLTKLNDEKFVAKSELQGVQISRQMMDVLIQTQKHRGQVNLKISGQDVNIPLSKTRSSLKTALDRLNVAIEAAPDFELGDTWKPIAEELRQLVSGQIAATTAENFAQHTRLITQIMHFSTLNNEKSGLLFDPVAASYLLMDIGIQKIPAWIEHLAVLRGSGAAHMKAGTIEFAGKAALISRLDALTVAIASATEMDEALKRAGETIAAEQQAALKESQDFAGSVRKNLLGESVSGDPISYFSQGTSAIEKTIALQNRLHSRLSDLLGDRISMINLQRNSIILTLLFAFLATGYLVFGFYLGFTRSMREVGRSAHLVAAGDLTNQVHMDGNDELAQAGNALETMNTHLSGVVANVRNDANMVSFLGRKLVSGIGDMTIRTEQQASSLEQTTASVQDLSETVKKNALSAKAADSLASNVRLIAEAGGDSMKAAVETMEGIHNSAKKMEEIVSLIDRIAFQTDILALNAAVEAAHAGEQGKGFAVVASEVRGLAQRSADAARQIRRLIDDSVSRVETGVEQIGDVSLTLSDIVSGIRNLAMNTNSISVASSEQSNGLAQISDAIKHLDEITQSNSKMAEEAKDSSIELEQRAHTLSQAVSSFKLRQGTADEAFAMVKKAVSLFRVNGLATLQRITDDHDVVFNDRDMYVFAFDRNGQYLAFAGNPSKLSVNLMNVNGLDGRKLVQDAFALPETGGWVVYTIVNPVTQRIENKTSYIESITDDIVLGCGVYHSL
jgi:methyl-accepting chemotaxis protein